MTEGNLRSPCHDCIIHLRGLSKLDHRLPCRTCRLRLAYAAAMSNTDYPPTAPYQENIYPVSTELLDLGTY